MAVRTTARSALEAAGWSLSCLFLVFLGINLAWECTLALLKFFDDLFFGRGSSWIQRVKEEILGLGVISLVLIFLEPELLKICVPDTEYEAYDNEDPGLSMGFTAGGRALQAEADHHPCPPGRMHLFPKVVITASHFLLFYIAVVHIIYSFISFSLTLRRFRGWLAWEQKARTTSLRQRYHLGAFSTLELYSTSQLPLSTSVREGSATGEGQASGLSQQAAQHQRERGERKGATTSSAAAAAAGPCMACRTGCMHVLSPMWAVVSGQLHPDVFSGLRDLFLTKAALTMQAESPPAVAPPAADSARDQGALPAHGSISLSQSADQGDAAPAPADSMQQRPLARQSSGTNVHLLQAMPPTVLALTPLSVVDLRTLHSLHFTNAAEQLVEAELTQVWAHAWALALFTAMFMLFPQEAWQAVWISGLAVLLCLVIIIKIQAALNAAAALGSTWPQQLLAMHKKRRQEDGARSGRAPPRQQGPGDMELGNAPCSAGQAPGPGTQSALAPASPPQPTPSSSSAPAPAAAQSAPCPVPAYTPDSAVQALNTLCHRLLWFHHSMPLLWLINIVFVINSLSITIALYFLVAYQGAVSTTWDSTLQTWIPLLVADTILALYLGAVVVPQYALLSACCGHSHAALMRILRSSKRSSMEPEERGVSGLVLHGLFKLKRLCQACMARVRHPSSGLPATVSHRGELALLSTAGSQLLGVFIRGLAFRAGVILPLGHSAFSAHHQASSAPPPHQAGSVSWAGHPAAVLPLYRELVRVWMAKVVASGSLPALCPGSAAAAELSDWSPSTELTSALGVILEAFSVIDRDGSGAVTLMELRDRLVEVLETKPTTNELRTMVHLIDLDCNKQITVREMCVFCAHEFFSTGSLHPGAIDATSLHSSLVALGLPSSCCSEGCVLALLAYPAGDEELRTPGAGPSRAPVLGLLKFASLFKDMELLD